MRVFFFLLVFGMAFPHSLVYSQIVQWSQAQSLKGGYGIWRIIEHEGAFYTIKAKSASSKAPFLVEKYNSDMELLFERQLNVPREDNQLTTLEDIKKTPSGFVLLFSRFVRETSTYSFFGRLYNNDMEPDGDVVSLVSIENARNSYFGAPEIQETPDGKRVVVFFQQQDKNTTAASLHFSCFNIDLSPVWKKTLEIGLRDFKRKYIELAVDGKTNVFLLSAIEINDKKARKLAGKNLEILSYYPEENIVKEFEIDLGNKWLSSASLRYSPTGMLYVGGFYSNQPDERGIAGTFFLSINPETRQTDASTLKPFDRQLLSEFYSESKLNKEQQLPSFRFSKFIVKPDGGVYFAAEQYYETVTTYMDYYSYYNAFPTTTVNYYYNDIVVVSVSATGEIEWTKKIAKKQSSTNDKGYYLSFALHYDGNNLYFLYNENPKNLSESAIRENRVKYMSNSARAVAAMVIVNPKGETSKKALFSGKDSGTILRPKIYLQHTQQSFLLYGQTGKRYKLGKANL
ncbi:MAG: hypothetical protein ACK4K0_07060 [Flavobacteriales bacterium]